MNGLILIFFSLFLDDLLSIDSFFSNRRSMSIDLFFSGFFIFSLLIFSGFIAHLYGVFAMKTNQWNRRFLQSMLLGLLLMFFGLFLVDSKAAEPELRMGVSTYSDFKEIVPDQSEGDFGQKLKDLTDKTAAGKNSGYWREALDKQFNLSFDVGNSSKRSGYYFVTDINHPALNVIPMQGSKTEKILCLMIYETDSEISNLLVCKDPEHDMLVLGEYAGGSF